VLAGPSLEVAAVAHLEALLREKDIERKREGVRYMQSRSWLATALGSFDESLVADDLLLDIVDGGFFDPDAAGDLLADGVIDGATDSARKDDSESEDEELEGLMRQARDAALLHGAPDGGLLEVKRGDLFVDGGVSHSSDRDGPEGEGERSTARDATTGGAVDGAVDGAGGGPDVGPG